MDLIFQGRASFNKGQTLENLTQAHGFFKRALALDPRNVDALVGAAQVDLSIGASCLTDDRTALFAAAETASIKALSVAPDFGGAHLTQGVVHILTNRAAQGIAECERALELDGNLADAHVFIGWAKFLLGRGGETEAHINEGLRLSPRDVGAFRWKNGVGLVKSHLGADAEAVVWFRRSIEANPNQPMAHFLLAASLARLGEMKEARAAVQAGLALNPSFTVRRYRVDAESDNPTYLAGRERLYEGLRLAGVPER
jgi:tetratricopeptide (TPR) repeat protein